MKSEDEIRLAIQRLFACAYLNSADEMTALPFWLAHDWLKWILDEWEPDWTDEDIRSMDRVYAAIERSEKYEEN